MRLASEGEIDPVHQSIQEVTASVDTVQALNESLSILWVGCLAVVIVLLVRGHLVARHHYDDVRNELWRSRSEADRIRELIEEQGHRPVEAPKPQPVDFDEDLAEIGLLEPRMDDGELVWFIRKDLA